jgi:uncharacterized protein YkwD
LNTHRLVLSSALAVCALTIIFSRPSIVGAQSNAVTDMAARINHERVTRGLAPYALNAQLTNSAQAHADDIARTQQFGHVGSDGSTTQQRVERAGYANYSWGFRVGENWARFSSVASAFAMWMDSPDHRNNILHAYYREIGIGVAATRGGGFVYVVDFGAQPNTLPFFIDDDLVETQTTAVTLTLSDERVMPNGDGVDRIGHPIDVQISNDADFTNARWQPYAQKIEWILAPGNGTKTVFVKYRDARGRLASARQSITLKLPASPTPSQTATLTPRATDSPTIELIPTATATSTATPTLAVAAAASLNTINPSNDGITTTALVSALGVAMIIGGAAIVSNRAKDAS